MAALVYLIHEHGGTIGRTRTPFNSQEEALAQGAHDAAHGFGEVVRIESAGGKVLVDTAEIQKQAETLR